MFLVEGIAGNEVEQHQGRVDVGKVFNQTQEGFDAGNQRLHRVEYDRKDQTHERTGNRDKKLRNGAGRLRPDLCDTPEEEKRNAAHRNLIPQSNNRMPEFMEEHTHKEHDRSRRSHDPVQDRRPVLELSGIITTRQHPGEQPEDHKPGVIQTNRDPENLT